MKAKFSLKGVKNSLKKFWNNDAYCDERIGLFAALTWLFLGASSPWPWFVVLSVALLVFLFVAGTLKVSVDHPAVFIMLCLIIAMVFTWIHMVRNYVGG